MKAFAEKWYKKTKERIWKQRNIEIYSHICKFLQWSSFEENKLTKNTTLLIILLNITKKLLRKFTNCILLPQNVPTFQFNLIYRIKVVSNLTLHKLRTDFLCLNHLFCSYEPLFCYTR